MGSQPIDTENYDTPVLPRLSYQDVLDCQFSSWYPKFQKKTIRAQIIRPLPTNFREYLLSDGIQIPIGSEDQPITTELSDDGENSDDDSQGSVDELPTFSFPTLDSQIRKAIISYGAVFPKLNWTSPRDATWILAPSSPLKCTSPADVYLYLKSSDFILHDLQPDTVWDQCTPTTLSVGEVDAVSSPSPSPPEYELELVVKKWYAIETSREFRCFVRGNHLIGISQRDSTYYDFLNETETQASVRKALISFWSDTVRTLWTGGPSYVFDALVTRDLTSALVLDFQPFATRTDSLLFTFEDLHNIFMGTSNVPADSSPQPRGNGDSITALNPELRVITSRMHPATSRGAPQNAHNMMPREALELSAGRNVMDFQEAWADELAKAVAEQKDEDS